MMSDNVGFCIWLGSAAIIAVGWNGWITWRQLRGDDVDDNDRVFTLLALIWPGLIAVVLICGIAYVIFHVAPKKVILLVIKRWQRVAEREQASQRDADSRRYVDESNLR